MTNRGNLKPSSSVPRSLTPHKAEAMGNRSTEKTDYAALGYEPAFEVEEVDASTSKRKMTEPRARAARHKGQLNFPGDSTSNTSRSTFDLC